MKTLLLTAFAPFGGEQRNAALDAVQRTPEQIGDWKIVKCTVPTVFGESIETVTAAIASEKPDAVLMVGQAGARNALTPERVARNRIDARIPDNAGQQPRGVPVVPGGPERCRATLPVEEMNEAIRAAGIAAEVSEDAGSFVCNALFYGVLHWLGTNELPIPAGFLHVPRSEEQAQPGQPSLPLELIVKGMVAAIRTLANALHL